jgi:hypothetical protein
LQKHTELFLIKRRAVYPRFAPIGRLMKGKTIGFDSVLGICFLTVIARSGAHCGTAMYPASRTHGKQSAQTMIRSVKSGGHAVVGWWALLHPGFIEIK